MVSKIQVIIIIIMHLRLTLMCKFQTVVQCNLKFKNFDYNNTGIIANHTYLGQRRWRLTFTHLLSVPISAY